MTKLLFSFGSQATVSTAQSSPSTSPTAISDDSAAAPSSVKGQIENIHARVTRSEGEELAYKRKIVPRLARRAYHLEKGNSWWTDWVQYQRNTHPVLGLFMYHRLHPIRFPQRIIILTGSIGERQLTSFFRNTSFFMTLMKKIEYADDGKHFFLPSLRFCNNQLRLLGISRGRGERTWAGVRL
jgi:hypothetical protein